MEITASAAAQTHQTSRTVRRLMVTLIAALVLGWTGWWGFKHVMWWTPAGHDIAQVVRGAAGVNETLLIPPQAYRNVPITAAEMSTLSRTAQRKLANYYTGDLLRGWREIAKRTLNPKDLHWGKTSAWMTQWRVDWIHLGELTLLPGSATATATATATASMEVRSNAGDINRMDYTFHLVDSRVGWRVDREESEFQPGYGP
jgi:hypothetical protein